MAHKLVGVCQCFFYGRTVTVLHGVSTGKEVSGPSPSRQGKDSLATICEASSPLLPIRDLIAFPGSCREASQNWGLAVREN